MNFFSSEFALFIIFMFATYWLVPRKYRRIPLLIGGVVFYAFAGVKYILILIVFVISSFLIGILIEKRNKEYKHKKALLCVGIFNSLLTLLFFKYLNFIINIFSDISRV